MRGRGHRHFAQTEGLPLSLKCMFNGRARYTIGRAEFCVDDGGFMIVNEGEPYTIGIASPTPVESFIFWFPQGWAEEVAQTLATGPDAQLDDPQRIARGSVEFFPRYIPHEDVIMPRVRELRSAYKSGEGIHDSWMEERLRELLAAMLQMERNFGTAAMSLTSARASTREELSRRLHRGRDFLHAHASDGVSLAEAARVACLSPFHFLRSFKQAFGVTPHQYLTRCRIERAKFLLACTGLPVTDICFDAGFLSVGSFVTLFHRQTGMTPRMWRAEHATGENRKIREVFLTARQ